MSNQSCVTLVRNHATPSTDITYWQARHYLATISPRGSERGILTLIRAFAEMADASSETDILLGQDGYFHEHAADLINAMRAYLNFDCGRLDCGTLDRLICELAVKAGVELD